MTRHCHFGQDPNLCHPELVFPSRYSSLPTFVIPGEPPSSVIPGELSETRNPYLQAARRVQQIQNRRFSPQARLVVSNRPNRAGSRRSANGYPPSVKPEVFRHGIYVYLKGFPRIVGIVCAGIVFHQLHKGFNAILQGRLIHIEFG